MYDAGAFLGKDLDERDEIFPRDGSIARYFFFFFFFSLSAPSRSKKNSENRPNVRGGGVYTVTLVRCFILAPYYIYFCVVCSHVVDHLFTNACMHPFRDGAENCPTVLTRRRWVCIIQVYTGLYLEFCTPDIGRATNNNKKKIIRRI